MALEWAPNNEGYFSEAFLWIEIAVSLFDGDSNSLGILVYEGLWFLINT